MVSKWEPFRDRSHPLSTPKYHRISDNANIYISSLYLSFKYLNLIALAHLTPPLAYPIGISNVKCPQWYCFLFLSYACSSHGEAWLPHLRLFFPHSMPSWTVNLLALPSEYIQNLTTSRHTPHYQVNPFTIIFHQDSCSDLPTSSLVLYGLFLTELPEWSS